MNFSGVPVDEGIDYLPTQESPLMDSLAKIWNVTLEKPLYSLGLENKLVRFSVIAALGSGLIWVIKPDAQFDLKGNARKWIITSPNVPGATPFPWWFPPLTVAVLVTLFV